MQHLIVKSAVSVSVIRAKFHRFWLRKSWKIRVFLRQSYVIRLDVSARSCICVSCRCRRRRLLLRLNRRPEVHRRTTTTTTTTEGVTSEEPCFCVFQETFSFEFQKVEKKELKRSCQNPKRKRDEGTSCADCKIGVTPPTHSPPS